MSIGKNKSNSNNSFNGTGSFNKTDTINSTTAPTNPDWVTSLAKTLGGNISTLNGTDPSSYVASPTQSQGDAASAAHWLGTDNGGWQNAMNNLQLSGDTSGLTALTGQPAPQAAAQTGASFMNNYLNPYTNDVVNASLNSFDNNAGQTRAQDDLALAGSGAFGGSGAAIQKALTEGQLGLARGQLESGLRSSAFNTAAGYGMNDADRAAQVSEANANLALQNKGLNANTILSALQQKGQAGTNQAALEAGMDANARANAGTQFDIGSGLRDVTQQQLTAPLALQQYLTSLFSGLPLGLFNGQTQTGTDNSTGTETQSGSGSGKATGFNFGFKI